MTDITHDVSSDFVEPRRGLVEKASEWARTNLFNSVLNSLLTLVIAYGLVRLAIPLFNWAIVDATFSAPNDTVCKAKGGACWAFIADWANFLLFGRFPAPERWRPALVIAIFVALMLVSSRARLSGKALLGMWAAGVAVSIALMFGGFLGMEYVETDLWNGIPLNLLLTIGGCGVAFPVAILAALGRRSRMPAIRWISIGYIELIRGVPLITVLFMATVMVPLFLPSGVTIAKLWRAEVAFTLFFGAYLAEAIRGGLQVIPRGQYEAADALGLGYWRKTWLVILPQALTISIPSLVNTSISAFKDTVLITVVGIFDVLGDVNNAMNAPEWRSAYWEGYSFVALIFFAVCFYMSRYSQRLERSLSRARPGPRRN
ncbi:MAG TPA: amino acid ABC transporter permease [Stellaceae bacterium]|nr:amino acid ABC transporter permease [Stellaceae bacterium]